MLIRPEISKDMAAIRHVNEEAFGQKAEAEIIEKLRSRRVLTISLVAIQDDELVGHISDISDLPPVLVYLIESYHHSSILRCCISSVKKLTGRHCCSVNRGVKFVNSWPRKPVFMSRFKIGDKNGYKNFKRL